MSIVNFLVAIAILLFSTCLFCLLMTTNLGWGPVVYVSCFLGGIVLIGWTGVACLDLFKD
ncbi:hypothetical protein [Myxosarcina sp. GI1]|uniref:hypothetical protein n=1 Tax=Myxosarcina sp. GI1 TaxID=1541065 RepID=UPI0005647657|nr:hypothetical protein [Myxosarcina sp. GI1]